MEDKPEAGKVRNPQIDADRILVIKLGALGDFLQAIGPMQAIRKAYPNARISLLTTAPFRKLADASGLFESILIDDRPGLWNVAAVLSLRAKLRAEKPDFVFDLQTSDRSSFYRTLLWPLKPGWSGIAKGCSHPHDNPKRDFMHTVDRQAEQLRIAGIHDVALPDISFLANERPAGIDLPDRYVLLVPGGAPHRPDKRWPPENYGKLAGLLVEHGLVPVVLGAAAEQDAASVILDECPNAVSLVGKTSLLDIAGLASGAEGAVGNDTGPMHMIAAAGCPSVVLFSGASDPSLTAPRGPDTTVLQRDSLADLPLAEVAAALSLR